MVAGCYNRRIFLDLIAAHCATSGAFYEGKSGFVLSILLCVFRWPHEARKNFADSRILRNWRLMTDGVAQNFGTEYADVKIRL
jgi:hypothetical protein